MAMKSVGHVDFKTYQGVDSFIKQTIAGAEERGYVETIFGRRRYLPRINSRNKTEKALKSASPSIPPSRAAPRTS